MLQPVQLQNALWAILDRLDPDEAQRERFSEVPRLLETIRLYELSPKINQLLKCFGDHRDRPPNSDWSSLTTETLAELNSWLTELGLPTVEKVPIAPPPKPAPVPETHLIPAKSTTPLSPLPLTWPEFVLGVRERLQSECGSLRPFARWTLPQHRWSSRWIDAFAVIATDEHDSNTGFILVPSDDAATSPEAEKCWRKRIETALYLQRTTATSQVARVLLHTEAESACGIALLRSEFTRRTLADRVQGGDCLSPRECVELGISLCGILGALNAHGINVLDLSPSWIAFDWGAGQRFTQLLDPTAVIPGRGLLPEWRGTELGLADAAELAKPEPSQVFLVGALVLALMCRTIDDLLAEQFPNGRSATFASLSGSRNLADSHSNSIAAPLVADLTRKAAHFHEEIDSQAVVEALQWSVAERHDERFDTLLRFAAAMRNAVR